MLNGCCCGGGLIGQCLPDVCGSPSVVPGTRPICRRGSVRFNINLYQDGKVCLSLLGNNPGYDATEKWQPGSSSLFQVLLSIQVSRRTLLPACLPACLASQAACRCCSAPGPRVPAAVLPAAAHPPTAATQQQGLILVAEPYFVQGETGMRGTAEGDASALRYHADIWLNTMRHAMAGVLRSPRPGFEEVITAHFRWGADVV